MGQKVNPTSLRLHPQNKHFDSCWFSEKRYADSIHKDLNVGTYYNGILKQIQYPSAACFLEASPRKCQISFTFLNPKHVREQSFKQLSNVNGRDKRRKQNALFSGRKQTTSLYGLLEKKGGSLGLSPSYLLAAPFFQGFKKKSTVFSLEKTLKEGKEREKGGALVRAEDLMFSSFLQVKKRDLQNKRIASSCLHLPKKMQSDAQQMQSSRQNYLEIKKGVCSNMLGLAISQYFVQRNLSGNFLSAASRFLLLQALFSFLKRKKDWPDIFNKFSQQEKKSTFHVSHSPSITPILENKIDVVHQMDQMPHHGNVQIGTPFLSERLAHNLHALPNQYNKFANQTSKQGKSPYEAWGLSLCSAWRNDLLSHLRKSSIYTYHIESIISNRLKSSCKISLFRAQNVAQSALFIAEEIVYQLQRRNSFRQIKTKFLQELANKSAIKGVRVTCVGRIGGRAKKAQRARGESFKMGQTSLHLFDSKVSFTSKTAFTPYGAVGVKVWVCWK